MRKSQKNHLFFSKFVYTIIIISIYAVMRKINLYGVDAVAMSEGRIDADVVLGQIVGGDLYRCSITAIGFAPYMIASILVMIIQAAQPSDVKNNVSAKKMNRYTIFLTVIIALIQAILRSNELLYVQSGVMGALARFVSVYEMVLGTLLIVWLSMRNKKYGIGGQMALILVNIFDGILKTIDGVDIKDLHIPLALGIVMMLIMIFMENAEKRIPLQRISIHNIYADKNYQAIKFNPIGVMPVLFASAVLMIPQFVIKTILINRPDDESIIWLSDNMVLGKPLGILVYIAIIYLLNLLFALIMINPKDMMENFQKSGDGIENMRPGKETRRYISKNIWFRTTISSTVLSICLGGSLLLQMNSGVGSSIAMMPSSIMMFSGIGCTMYREAEAIINTDSYRAFI